MYVFKLQLVSCVRDRSQLHSRVNMCSTFTEIMIFLVWVSLMTYAMLYLYRRRKFYVLSWKLPGPIGLPLIGNALSLFCKSEDFLNVITNIIRKYPSPMKMWLGSKMVVIISDAFHAEKIMSSMKFAAKDDIYKLIEPLDGLSLITASGAKWKRDRRLMGPLFLNRNVTQYFPSILKHVKILVHRLQEKIDQPIFNINHYIHECVADFVNETVIGIRTNIQKGEMKEMPHILKRLYTLVYSRMLQIWLHNDILFKLSPLWKEYNEGKQYVQGFFKKALREVRQKDSSNDRKSFRPILNHLIEIQSEIGEFATDEELIHHLTTLYSASEDTVQTITSFTLVLLGMYPNIQNKVSKEIDTIFGNYKRDIEESDLIRLEYLDMVLKDVLRLFPCAPLILRKSSEDFELEKWKIPKDSTICISIQNIHRDSRYWEKPNEFYPDHFLPGTVQNRSPYAFLPLSAGPRGCIGKAYAYMSMKILIVTILRDFKLESEGTLEEKKIKADISTRFQDDVYPVRLRKRC